MVFLLQVCGITSPDRTLPLRFFVTEDGRRKAAPSRGEGCLGEPRLHSSRPSLSLPRPGRQATRISPVRLACRGDLFVGVQDKDSENPKSVTFQFRRFPASEKKQLPSTSEFSKGGRHQLQEGGSMPVVSWGRVGKLIRQPISGEKRQKRLRHI